MSISYRPVLLLVALAAAAPAFASSESDHRDIITASRDYIDGWYEGDAVRMERSLHPELAKRLVYVDENTKQSRLSHMGALTLINRTRAGGGSAENVTSQDTRVQVLDLFENAAVVKVTGPDWVDYLQLGRWNGRWVIINVLWELVPKNEGTGQSDN